MSLFIVDLSFSGLSGSGCTQTCDGGQVLANLELGQPAGEPHVRLDVQLACERLHLVGARRRRR